MIGYLSGPITGHKDYRRQFAKAAAALKEMGYNASRELGFALGTDKIIVSLEQLLTKEVTLS